MRKFFQKLKMDAKFARAGEGHKLTEDTRLVSFYPRLTGLVNVVQLESSTFQLVKGGSV